MLTEKKCCVCGNVVEMIQSDSLRENFCPACGASKRNRDVAKLIIQKFACQELSLFEGLDRFKHIYIYEAQASGPIHDILKNLPNYTCSEYFDNVPIGISDNSGIQCEDLQRLTFIDDLFDLVITQDVLEHIANPKKTFLEINRVLKQKGIHVFTVPLHEDRKTITRAKIDNQNNIINLLPPVYHGDPLREKGTLVYTDFGDDLIDCLESKGIPTEIVQYNVLYDIDEIPNVDNIEEYEIYQKYYAKNNLLKYFKYNSVVFVSGKCWHTRNEKKGLRKYLRFFRLVG